MAYSEILTGILRLLAILEGSFEALLLRDSPTNDIGDPSGFSNTVQNLPEMLRFSRCVDSQRYFLNEDLDKERNKLSHLSHSVEQQNRH